MKKLVGPIRGKEVPFGREVPLRKRRHVQRREVVDGRPLEPPLGYKRAPSLSEQIRAMVQGEALAYAAKNAGKETFEEADDFDVEDDFDPSSPYEEVFDPPETWDDKAIALGEAMERGRARFVEKEEKRKAREVVKEVKTEDKKEKEPEAKK